MEIEQIFPEWGSRVRCTREEFDRQPEDFWADLTLERNLLVFESWPVDLTDEEFYSFGSRFGRVWTREDYQRPYITRGSDPTLPDPNSETPVSYFQSHNNAFGAAYMAYHADMPHVNELSYPGRALYMVNNTQDGSGTTTWLNMELGWAQCTEEEKARYHDIRVVHHDMYQPETRLESWPFLKTNPKTGRVSPRLNCWYSGHRRRPDGGPSLAWIHHCEQEGRSLGFEGTGQMIMGCYRLLESKKNTVYQHRWREGDIVVYDNWFNVHRRDAVRDGAGPGGRRLLKRLSFNFI